MPGAVAPVQVAPAKGHRAPAGEAWLFSVSISRMNFSASMGVTSLIRLGAEQLRPPRGRSGGRHACLPQIGGSSAGGLLLPEHPIRVLLLRANVLRSGAR